MCEHRTFSLQEVASQSPPILFHRPISKVELRVPSSPFARTFDKESSPFPPAMTSGRPPYIHFTHAYPVSNIHDSLPLIARQALPLIITISLLSLPRAPSTFSISLKLSTGPGISQGVHIPDEEHRKYSLPVT